MRFSVSRDMLLKPLSWFRMIIDKSQTLSVLQNTFIKVEQGSMTIVASDSEVELSSVAEVDAFEDGCITFPGKKVYDWLRQLPNNSTVEVSLDEHRWFKLVSEGSRCRTATLAADDFPFFDFPDHDLSFSLPSDVLKYLLDRVSFSMAHQDVRYFLNGLLLDLKPGLVRLVATDGHRLSLSQRTVDYVGSPIKIILPRKAIIELSRLIEASNSLITVLLSVTAARFSLTASQLTTKLIDGKFPDYEKVLPRNLDFQVVIAKDSFRNALGRLAVFSHEKAHSARIVLTQNQIELIATNSMGDEASEVLSVDYSDKNFESGFNLVYMQDILLVLEEPSILLSFAGEDSPILVQELENRDCSYIVMPMRI